MRQWFLRLVSGLRKGQTEPCHQREDDFEADEASLLAFLFEIEDPDAFPRVENLVRSEFQLYSWKNGSAWIKAQYERDMERLARNVALADVMQFHGDGRIREKSLDLMEGPIGFPVVAYGLIARLNDWVPEVREAAHRALVRRWSPTQAETLAPAVWMTFRHGATWSRWQDNYAGFVDLAMRRSELCDLLVARLCSERSGGISAVFHAMCRSSHLDPCLERIAADAVQPHLRAIALRCISTGRLSWPSGRWRRLWIDKAGGVFRNVPEMESRPLSTRHDLPAILRESLQDRSAMVRKHALDELITHRHDARFQSLILTSLQNLAHDHHPAVAGRLDYLRRSLDRP